MRGVLSSYSPRSQKWDNLLSTWEEDTLLLTYCSHNFLSTYFDEDTQIGTLANTCGELILLLGNSGEMGRQNTLLQ